MGLAPLVKGSSERSAGAPYNFRDGIILGKSTALPISPLMAGLALIFGTQEFERQKLFSGPPLNFRYTVLYQRLRR